MHPYFALSLWLILVTWLVLSDPARDGKVSAALWIPLTWLFIVGTRLPSQWLGGVGNSENAAAAIEDGNPVDRTIYLLLMTTAVVVLLRRRVQWREVLWNNLAVVALLGYSLLSVLWSELPLVAFKKWFRDLGVYLTILIVLSDSEPRRALRVVLRRLCYLIIPLSILLVKYFPELARDYDPWSGAASFIGATTSKNMLGVACLMSGIFFFWETARIWSKRRHARTKSLIALNLAFLAMTLWLLNLSNSATSRLCAAIGFCVILLAEFRPALLRAGLPILIGTYVFVEFVLGIDIRSTVASSVGRDPSLTGRTQIWEVVLGAVTNPILGTGYETFWLGPRLLEVWRKTGIVGLNNAHNGYLELYLNLGLVGLGVLSWILIDKYRVASKRLSGGDEISSLCLCFWTIVVFYNFTEAAFKSQLLFFVFLLGSIVVTANGPQSGKAPDDRLGGRKRAVPNFQGRVVGIRS